MVLILNMVSELDQIRGNINALLDDIFYCSIFNGSIINFCFLGFMMSSYMFNYQTSFVEYKDRVKLLRQSILELSEKTNDRYKNEALENILLVLAAENPKLTQRVLENIHNYVFWNQELIEDVWNQDIEATDSVVAKLQQESGKNTIK